MSLIYSSSQSANNFDESHTSRLSPGLMWVLGKSMIWTGQAASL